MSIPVFAFLGDPAMSRNEAERIIQERSPDRDPLCFQRIAIEEASVLLPRELMSFSMFSPNKVFWVGHFEDASVDVLEFLLLYVNDSAEDSAHTLILTGKSLPKKGPIQKLKSALQKKGTFVEFQKVNPIQYLNELCDRFALQLSPKGKNIVLQRVGTDLLSLENEVEKLVCFSSGKPISENEVEELITSISETSIWELMDSLLMKDTGTSMLFLHHLLEEGHASHLILSMIIRQVRQLIELQESLQRNKPLPSSWVRVPERKRQNVIRILQKHPLYPHKIFSHLQKSNRLCNSARAGDRRILELLVLEMCSV